MHKWLIWFGYALVALGAALLSPIDDLLPVEFLPYLSGDFARSERGYLRVVPAGNSTLSFLAFVLLATGAVALATEWLARWHAKPRQVRECCLTLHCIRRPTAGFASLCPRVSSNVRRHEKY